MVLPAKSRYLPGTILNRLGEAIVPPTTHWNRGASGPWSKKTGAGTTVDEDNVMELDSVLACVRVLAEEVASLPFELFVEDKAKDECVPDVDHPVYELMRWQPNDEGTAYELTFEMVVDAVIRGYGAAQVLRSASGKVLALWPLEARYLKAHRAPDNKRLIYRYCLQGANSNKQEIMLEKDEVLIFKMFPGEGINGRSLIRIAAESLGAAKAADDFSAEFFQNGSIHTGMIEIPEELSDEAYTRLKKEWKETHTGKGNRHRAPILEGGAKFNALALNNEEAQLLETQKFKRSTIAGLLRVPAHLIGDLEKATFSNIEHADLGFAKHSLRPWLTMREQRCRMTLLTPAERKTRHFSHDLTDLIRGDFQTQMEGYSKGITAGVYCANEVRRKFKLNPYVGGDTFYVQGALRPSDEPYQPAAPAKDVPGKPGKPTNEIDVDKLLS